MPLLSCELRSLYLSPLSKNLDPLKIKGLRSLEEMAVNNLAKVLQPKLSPDAKILTASDSEQFQQQLERWSDLDLKIPTAIVLAGTEQDVTIVVSFRLSKEFRRRCLEIDQRGMTERRLNTQ